MELVEIYEMGKTNPEEAIKIFNAMEAEGRKKLEAEEKEYHEYYAQFFVKAVRDKIDAPEPENPKEKWDAIFRKIDYYKTNLEIIMLLREIPKQYRNRSDYGSWYYWRGDMYRKGITSLCEFDEVHSNLIREMRESITVNQLHERDTLRLLHSFLKSPGVFFKFSLYMTSADVSWMKYCYLMPESERKFEGFKTTMDLKDPVKIVRFFRSVEPDFGYRFRDETWASIEELYKRSAGEVYDTEPFKKDINASVKAGSDEFIKYIWTCVNLMSHNGFEKWYKDAMQRHWFDKWLVARKKQEEPANKTAINKLKEI